MSFTYLQIRTEPTLTIFHARNPNPKSSNLVVTILCRSSNFMCKVYIYAWLETVGGDLCPHTKVRCALGASNPRVVFNLPEIRFVTH